MSNRLLATLSREEFALLEPHLEAVDLPLRTSLEKRNQVVDQVYFIAAGFASVVAHGGNKPSIEVGLIGREGMSGLSVVMGGPERAVHDTYMQAGGHGQRLSAATLRQAIASSHALHQRLLRFAHAFMIQTSMTALANGRSKIDERLARWLLLAEDRLGEGELLLTHEFLGLMLGTHRPGVTLAVKSLEAEGLIETRRGKIKILDRKALERKTGGTYTPPSS